MDSWSAIQALILGIVEGITEFLPVSSTGHLIIASDLLDFRGERAEAFNIIIQTGAILAVMWHYRARIVELVLGLPRERGAQQFALSVIVAFLPAAVAGVLFADLIHAWLFNPVTVAAALVVGGVLMLWAERRPHRVEIEEAGSIDWTHALKIGCAQCIALVPGTSRSAATIIGGLLFGLSRRAATEFSFWLAMPTLVGAGVYSGWKHRELFRAEDAAMFALGTVVSFVVALLVVRWLLGFIARNSFAVFAWYRIGFGLLILATAWFGWVDWSGASA